METVPDFKIDLLVGMGPSSLGRVIRPGLGCPGFLCFLFFFCAQIPVGWSASFVFGRLGGFLQGAIGLVDGLIGRPTKRRGCSRTLPA